MKVGFFVVVFEGFLIRVPIRVPRRFEGSCKPCGNEGFGHKSLAAD